MVLVNRLPEYPLTELCDSFFHALEQGTLLLEAEPGAGKSTLAPLWVLAKTPAPKKIILVQPRVLAAQTLAQRLADLWGDELGVTVGYQVPYDDCTSSSTRLLVTTPGILLQLLLQAPMLDNVACVILDEIHERSVNQDTAWAWLQEVQILRDDLQLILMSATPDPQLQQQISQRLFAPGRCFPVTTEYVPAKSNAPYPEKIEEHLLRVLANCKHWQAETLLVFLPGWSEIEKCTQAIQAHYPQQSVFRLHSRVPAAEQKRALNPALGPRIILSTNIAETSLTIADVTLVIDSGLVRRADYEQRTGLTRLRLTRISQASADQRRGRAGRVQAGHCIRLWSQDQPLAAADLPEIRTTDYLPLVLRLAHWATWGSPAYALPWLEAPNKLALEFAQQQLQHMNFLDVANNITALGERVTRLGTHPRVAAFLFMQEKQIPESVMLLALVLHFEWASEGGIDDLLESAAQELKRNRQWQRQQKRWLDVLTLTLVGGTSFNATQLARAFSDRIGFQQESGRFRLNSGISVEPYSAVQAQYALFPIIIPKPKGHNGIAIPLQLSTTEQRALSQVQTKLVYKHGWQLHSQWRMGGVVIAEEFTPVEAEKTSTLLLNHIRELIAEKGLLHLQWSDVAQRLLLRARLIQQYALCALPPLDEGSLVNELENWLLPFLNADVQLHQLPWLAALEFYLGYDNCQVIAQSLPEKIELPSGRHVTVEFSAEGVPQVSAKLQEFFGCEQLQLADGKLPLKIHLLSPNGSPLAITMNLRSFWLQAYADVRKEMRGRYPRHPWPENPLAHEATALTKRKLAMQNQPT